MPTATLELPRDMVAAARTYAAREHKSVEALFFDWLHSSYGFTHLFDAGNDDDRPMREKQGDVQRLGENADETLRLTDTKHSPKWLDEIEPQMRSFVGIVSLPEGKSDDDLIYEAIMDKYNSIP